MSNKSTPITDMSDNGGVMESDDENGVFCEKNKRRRGENEDDQMKAIQEGTKKLRIASIGSDKGSSTMKEKENKNVDKNFPTRESGACVVKDSQSPRTTKKKIVERWVNSPDNMKSPRLRNVRVSLPRCHIPIGAAETTVDDDVVNKIVSWENYFKFDNIQRLKSNLMPQGEFNPLRTELPTEYDLAETNTSALGDFRKFCDGMRYLKGQAVNFGILGDPICVKTKSAKYISLINEPKGTDFSRSGVSETMSAAINKDEAELDWFPGLESNMNTGDEDNERDDSDWYEEEELAKTKKIKKGKTLLTNSQICQHLDHDGKDISGETGVERGKGKKENNGGLAIFQLEKSNGTTEHVIDRKRGPGATSGKYSQRRERESKPDEVSVTVYASDHESQNCENREPVINPQPDVTPFRDCGECPMCQRKFYLVDELERHAADCGEVNVGNHHQQELASCETCFRQLPLGELDDHAVECFSKVETRNKSREAAERRAGLKK